MVIKSVKVSDETIVVIGKQAARVLDDVSFIGTIKTGSEIDIAVKNAYNESDKYHNVSFAETNLGIQYGHQVSNKSFLKLCETMCQDADVGFRTVRNGQKILVEFYAPQEKQNLVFSEKFGNMSFDQFSISTEPLKNFAIVLGMDIDGQRTTVEVDETNGARRKSLIVDARDLQKEDGESNESYLKRLSERGHERLLECQEIISFAFTPFAQDFGKKYDLGDVLTVYMTDYGITLKSRVVRFTEKVQKNKTETKVEVGQIVYKR
jgi:hypothetical protein